MDDYTQLRRIRSQVLRLLAEVTAQPKPTYELDGQQVDWTEYLRELRRLLDWCDRKLAALENTEFATQAST